ncbi:Unknown protein [Striga hermonthica]|uniref:F-box domain-containing protein n=1 Tax=Striga hermonthica TaxID=68872 RepID=A0A9N7NNF7_STRHE|nr:Unknown protein [Striga hermonthica]
MPRKKQKKQAAQTADDRVSQLPIHILHHILCSLSQREAVRTCLLSKQWRYIGSTRPNLEFSFGNTQEKFVSVVDQTLQGYCDQNLSIHKLHLDLSSPDSRPVISLLDKWIPMKPALNIKVFKLDLLSYTQDLPPAVFLAEALEELHLCKCRVSPVVESVRLKSLRTLSLEQVQVDGGTLETVMLGCPLLTRLLLNYCWELRNVRLRSSGLKHLELCDSNRIKGCSIEIDVPNLETVFINGPWIWRQSTFAFSGLTSLYLCDVILSSESFDLLSSGCSTLARLALDNCSGFEEFHLASDSVKFLRIWTTEVLLKGVRICAPNIVSFQFIARISQAPDTFSFTTTNSKEWSSKVFFSSHEDDPDLDLNSWLLKLRRVLKAVSGSRISLFLQMEVGLQGVPCNAAIADEPPVVVQTLKFGTCKCRTADWYMVFMNGLFRVCRPSYLWGCRLMNKSDGNYGLSEFQLNILLAKRKVRTTTDQKRKKVRTKPYFWRHDLEQVSVGTLDGQQWQLIRWKKLGVLQKRTQDKKTCFILKWRS